MSETYNVIRYHCRLLPFSTFPVQRTEPLGLSFFYLPGIVFFFFLKMDFELFACKKKNLCIPASTNVMTWNLCVVRWHVYVSKTCIFVFCLCCSLTWRVSDRKCHMGGLFLLSLAIFLWKNIKVTLFLFVGQWGHIFCAFRYRFDDCTETKLWLFIFSAKWTFQGYYVL